MNKNITKKSQELNYFSQTDNIQIPKIYKTVLSRVAFPLLTLLSREQTLKLGLVPIDDERVIMALKYTKGYLLDVGCGANNFVRSYGNGVGVDVEKWQGCDKIIRDAAKLPFANNSFDTVSYLACLNHIPNRNDAVKEASRVLKSDGRIIITMITPKLGTFIHWLRFRNDPDNQKRHINNENELMGMSHKQTISILHNAGFINIKQKRFVFGLNNIYIAERNNKT
jgi:ubiquinone/menaquinone biosynthesis C-methylase UbiE